MSAKQERTEETARESPDVSALRRRCDLLREALIDAEADLRGRDEFLAIVAHELRNPMTPLVFTVDLLLTRLRNGEPLDEATLLRSLTHLRRQVDRLKGDLTRLLDFSRMRSGRVDLEPEPLDIVSVVAETIADMRADIEAAQTDVRLTAPDAAHGEWDRMRLRQVVWNLLSNALKYGAGRPVDVAITADESVVVLRIIDRGPGIAEHERARIWKRFERSSAQQIHTGFGVGLWIVKRIVDAVGGTIACESELGAGSTFIVTLPRRHHG